MPRRIINFLRLLSHSLTAHPGRTFLTLLGIVMSVAAIMIVVTLGDAVKQYVLDEIRAFGSQTVQVEVKVPATEHMSSENASGQVMGVQITTLTVDDATAIAQLPTVEAYSVGLIGQEKVQYDGEATRALLLSGTAATPRVDEQVVIADGAFFTADDEQRMARVVVLGSAVAEELFGARRAVGERIRIAGQSYTVVGVLAERGATFGFSFDDIIYVPASVMQKQILGVDYVQYITVRARAGADPEAVAQDITALLRLRHGTDGTDDDFAVATIAQAEGIFADVLGSVSLLLGLLAAVSLLVGGVGIMNVMLVAVEERMREIGLRRAVGARAADVQAQFLAEAVVIALIGALIGMMLGAVVIVIADWGVAKAGFDIPIGFSLRAPAIGVGFSLAAGLIFGFYPARRAAAIMPMAALRN